jgi:predicted amidophosphoribosyltransferase
LKTLLASLLVQLAIVNVIQRRCSVNTCDRCGDPIEDGLMYCRDCAAEIKTILEMEERSEREKGYLEKQYQEEMLNDLYGKREDQF